MKGLIVAALLVLVGFGVGLAVGGVVGGIIGAIAGLVPFFVLSRRREAPYWTCIFDGRKLSDIRDEAKHQLEVLVGKERRREIEDILSECYIKSGSRRFLPPPGYVTQAGDEVYFPRLSKGLEHLERGGAL